jgi:molecular chaperone GrpE
MFLQIFPPTQYISHGKFTSLQDKYLRALAEMENVRQRSRKQVEDAKLYGIQGFSKDILEVADVLQKATLSVPASALQRKDNPHLVFLYDGVKLTEAELQKVLKKNGVDQINPLGQMFDPVYHEAMFEVEGDKPGTVAHVTMLGYTLHGRTIRPARVGVVKQTDS